MSYPITSITNDPLQNMTLTLYNGNPLQLTLYFIPMQYGWFITNLVYAATGFTLTGLRITNQPNMLQQWRNVIPFGLGCFSPANREPSQQNDFISGAAQLFLLDQSEVEQFTILLENGTG